ncbi:ABC transporter substrate-binding protein [Fusobacterium russii]|uniref:ABC transporter substrate-binding protein n=1 Tax=Fusobacterium russii TaxID=854 RepID=UPI0003A3504F|nr:ABC transporter substrate-binding protein [Fusobacterium russii]
MKKFLCFLVLFFCIGIVTYPKITSQKKYNRIISLSMAGDEILHDMIDRDRVIAFRGKASNNEMTSILYNKINKFEKVEDNVERMIELEPDIIIAADWLKKEIRAQLEDAGINLYIYKTPFTYEEVQSLIKELASLLEEEERGEKIIKAMDIRLSNLQEKIKKTQKKSPRVLEYSHYEGTNGKGSIFDDMLKKVYAINLASEIGIGRFAKISKEAVIEMDPDIILVPIWNSSNDSKDQEFLKFIKMDKSYADLNVVKSNKVYTIPGKYIYVYSHYIIEGIENMAKSIYQLED